MKNGIDQSKYRNHSIFTLFDQSLQFSSVTKTYSK